MFLAVPGRNPAWASPPSGEAGPGKAVLVATGFLWAGADRGRLLMSRSGACGATSSLASFALPLGVCVPFGAAHSAKLIG